MWKYHNHQAQNALVSDEKLDNCIKYICFLIITYFLWFYIFDLTNLQPCNRERDRHFVLDLHLDLTLYLTIDIVTCIYIMNWKCEQKYEFEQICQDFTIKKKGKVKMAVFWTCGLHKNVQQYSAKIYANKYICPLAKQLTLTWGKLCKRKTLIYSCV